MRGDAEPEAPRPRPLSGGLWTLFSWLRRDDHTSSSESLSSAGSDRTVASFAFLTPAHYRVAAAPIVLPTPGPPTDSYKKRIRERNLRRQHDRDLTLHRKYGLYRGDIACGYDAFSLPPARRSVHNIGDRQDRDRRAVSETLQRRAAYVPGKRRAPSPPARVSATGVLTTLPQRHSRKRRAPQPPTKLIRISKENLQRKENIQMNHHQSTCDNKKLSTNVSMGGKSEKYTKKENNFDSKSKQEKSLLKKIFDNKKRNSAIETSSVRILPSISELDKQAAEIIETCKIKARENDNIKSKRSCIATEGERWLCITCSRFYDESTKTCSFCLPNKRPSSTIENKSLTTSTQTENRSRNISSRNENPGSDEKEKLKEMLKEMKHSLPKKTKSGNDDDITVSDRNRNKMYITSASLPHEENVKTSETPTLRIGSSKLVELKNHSAIVPSTSNKSEELSNNRDNQIFCIENIHRDVKDSVRLVVKSAEGERIINKNTNNSVATGVTDSRSGNASKCPDNLKKPAEVLEKCDKGNQSSHLIISKENKNLHTPLKISSLLNPIYVPKVYSSVLSPTISLLSNSNNLSVPIRDNQTNIINAGLQNRSQSVNEPTPSSSDSANITSVQVNLANRNSNILQSKISQPNAKTPAENVSVATTSVTKSITPTAPIVSLSTNQPKSIAKIDEINQHSKRRELINQLEQSIAKGDERAAAEAASKLAQLRLSCSVLSFTSQILGDSSKPSVSDNLINKSVVDTKNAKKKLPITTRPTPLAGTSHDTNTTKEDSAQVQLEKLKETSKELCNIKNKSSTATPQVEIKKTVVETVIPITIAPTEASTSRQVNEKSLISVWIEDKEAARGPVKLRIERHARLGDLRREAELSLGLQSRLQRWIVGRTLCADDNIPLVSLAGPDLNAPFYLYLVESDTKAKSTSPAKEQINKQDDKISEVYTELMQLERQALVPNTEVFECGVCMEDCVPHTGAVLRECVHSFCRSCLAELIRHCEEPAVPCPAMGCPGVLHEREVRALVTQEDYERWLARGLAAAESGTRNAFHCRTRDCTGWALCDPGVRQFPCPVCKCTNCVPCQAIHEGETCDQYRSKLQHATNTERNHTDEGTRALLSSLISRGEALECPQCNAIITKKWGCDWVKCSACKTEICWVTRGRRWGPAGRGDTSGGCRCGLDGKRCHPSCGYCH